MKAVLQFYWTRGWRQCYKKNNEGNYRLLEKFEYNKDRYTFGRKFGTKVVVST